MKIKKFISTVLVGIIMIILCLPVAAKTETTDEIQEAVDEAFSKFHEGILPALYDSELFCMIYDGQGLSFPNPETPKLGIKTWEFYKARTEGRIKFEDAKKYLLEYAAPQVVMHIFSCQVTPYVITYPYYLNINGVLYAQCFEAGITEGGLQDEIIVESVTDDRILFKQLVGYSDHICCYSEIVKIGGEWKVSYAGFYENIGFAKDFDDSWVQSRNIFEGFAYRAILGYMISENLNVGYEKYIVETPSDINTTGYTFTKYDIEVTKFNAETCEGSAFAMVNEYDKDGNFVAQRQITVEVGENLSETIYIDGVNPNTSDSNIVWYFLLVLTAVTSFFALKKIKAQ